MNWMDKLGDFIVGLALRLLKPAKDLLFSHPKATITVLMLLLSISFICNFLLLQNILENPPPTTSVTGTESISAQDDTTPTESSETAPTESSETAPTKSSKIVFLRDDIHPGKKINLGKYDQDEDPNNDSQDIEWIVLYTEEDSALLISTMGLDSLPYSKNASATTWESSSLRQWLNGVFYHDSFSNDEKDKIITKEIKQHTNPQDNACNQGSSTYDSVFLLSMSEYLRYMHDNGNIEGSFLHGVPTDRALMNDIDKERLTNKCWWWLRTSANKTKNACSVTAYGVPDYSYHIVTSTGGLVRPAIWIKLDGNTPDP